MKIGTSSVIRPPTVIDEFMFLLNTTGELFAIDINDLLKFATIASSDKNGTLVVNLMVSAGSETFGGATVIPVADDEIGLDMNQKEEDEFLGNLNMASSSHTALSSFSRLCASSSLYHVLLGNRDNCIQCYCLSFDKKKGNQCKRVNK